MILDTLTLQQFRSYTKETFTFSPQATLIVGVNTAGKTNILEAVYFLATGKSFRADQDREAIRWGNDLGRIKGITGETKLEIVMTGSMLTGETAPTKRYFVNGVARRLVDFIGNLRAVLFWPEHLELVTDSPSVRRKYLDSVLVQVDREYRRNLLSYERGLRQRNKLLDIIFEGKASTSQLVFWNQLLIKSGNYLTEARANYIAFINASYIAGASYQIVYDKSVISESRLVQYADEEVAARATLVGPHRDDIVFQKPERNDEWIDLSKYGSRGEQRLAILWLKLAEVSYVEKRVGERPTLLLDDIFSELDSAHRKLVMDLIGKQQTIITTAEPEVTTLMKREYPGIGVISLNDRTIVK